MNYFKPGVPQRAPGLLKLFSEKCVCLCMYVSLYTCMYVYLQMDLRFTV